MTPLSQKYIQDGVLPEQILITEISDEDLGVVLRENKISMTVGEARKLPGILGRNPTLTEAILWGIQGSEHCSYRSSRQYLKQFVTSGPTVMLGPSEDSGIVYFAEANGNKYGIVISHESHNHPSQIVPYEGAATGVGGVMRDILCMGCRPIACADPLRFGSADRTLTKLIANEVVSGIAGYGNPLGVPIIAGDVYFNESFDDNCLVNVVGLGILQEDELIHSYVPDEAAKENYDIIIIGKPTDNSGMGGAAFASADLVEEDKEANKGAVQEPNPFLERHVIESTVDLFKTLKKEGNLDKVGFKDMGAGGNVCASVEQVERVGLGANIDIAKVHVGMENLHPSVIALSETQERLCWMCHPSLTQQILDHYNKKWALPEVSTGAMASLVGKVTEGNFVLTYGDQVLVDAKPSDITEGIRCDRDYKAPTKNLSEPEFDEPNSEELTKIFLQILASENVCSRRSIYEKYDKVVQGQTIVQPGAADAGVIAPLRNREEVKGDDQKVGVTLTVDSNPRQSRISPYWSAANAVCEGLRNTAAVGATAIAITDCLNYGSPEVPEQMWEFVEGVRGVAEAAKGIKLKDHPEHCVPVVSGNVSFYNQSETQSVDASAVIGTLGRMDDAFKAVTMQLKKPDSVLFMIGERKDELGASEYYNQLGHLGANVPKADFQKTQDESYALIDLIDQDLVLASHDISDGGLAACVAEMALGAKADGQIGVSIDNIDFHRAEATEVSPASPAMAVGKSLLRFDKFIFSETGGFVIEVTQENSQAVESLLNDRNVHFESIGVTTSDSTFTITSADQQISLPLSDLARAWGDSMQNKLK